MKPAFFSLPLKASLILIAFMIAGLLLEVVGPARAATPGAPVTLTLQIQKEERQAAPDGTTFIKLVPVSSVVPGDRLVYVLSYANTGTQPVSDVVLDYPLPAGVIYRAAVEGSPAPLVSTDGAHFAAAPADAKPVTALRWRVPGALPPGARGRIAFKATLN